MKSDTTPVRSDADLEHEILKQLEDDPKIRTAVIGVAVQDGGVTLSGHVSSFAAEVAAEEATKRVEGVKAVVNDIEVCLPGSSEPTDAEITQSILQALQRDRCVPCENIQVTVDNGSVTLQGEVNWQFQRAVAYQDAHTQPGVKDITNLITVRPRVTPADVRANIEQAFKRRAALDAERITVTVSGSRVTLHGRARSWAEHEEIEKAVWAVPGVAEVDNQIVLGE